MGDSRTVARLASPGLVAACGAHRAAVRALDDQAETEDRSLERRIGSEADPEMRRRLIRLRRVIRHRSGLSADPSPEAHRVAACQGTVREAGEQRSAAFLAALAEGRNSLRELCRGNLDFRLSLLMSSISLSDRLEAWDEAEGPDAQRDMAFLRYWTRFAMKISPFSRFTGVCCLEATPAPGGVSLSPISEPASVARLNVQILEHLEALRGSLPSLGQGTLLAVNPMFVWRLEQDVSYITTVGKGSIEDLRLSGPQARLLRRLQAAGEFASDQAAPLVRRLLRIRAAEVPGLMSELVARGILVSLPPAHAMDADWIGAWLNFVGSFHRDGDMLGAELARLQDALRCLASTQAEPVSVEPGRRRSQLDAIAHGYGALLSLAPAAAPESKPPAPLRRESLLFEDLGVRLDAPILLRRHAEVCQALGRLGAAMAAPVDPSLELSEAVRARAEAGGMPFLEYLRQWKPAETATVKVARETSPGARWLRAALLRARGAQASDPTRRRGELHLASRDFPPSEGRPAGVPPWHTCLVQPVGEGEGSRLVLNSEVARGPVRLWSRFCSLLPPRVQLWIGETLADPDGETFHAELIDWSGSNVNLHPIFTRNIVLLSPRAPAGFSGGVIRIADLELRLRPEGGPRLFCPRLGKFILPIDMGFQGLGGHSPVYELLTRLGHAGGSSGSVPELAEECFGRHAPRIVLDQMIVIARAAWHFAAADLRPRRKGETLPEFFAATLDWAQAEGLPSEVFVRLNPDPVPKDQPAVGGPARQRRRDDYKPVYHRFDSALFLLQWERIVDKAADGVRIVEALPSCGGNLDFRSGRHVSEIVLNWK